jgi:hypothetical protein
MTRLKDFEQAARFANDIDDAAAALDQVMARWHEVGQSHWTGGSLNAPGEQNDAPAPREQAIFAALREARKVLSQAGHEAIMHGIELAFPNRSERLPFGRDDR